jgi:hypothetical protein
MATAASGLRLDQVYPGVPSPAISQASSKTSGSQVPLRTCRSRAASRRSHRALTSANQSAAREIGYLRGRLEEILARHCGQPLERIAKDTDRDYIVGGPEAVAYGLVDEVLSPRASLASVSTAELSTAGAARTAIKSS